MDSYARAIASLQNYCLELYLSTSDNLVPAMVGVIKWHINIKVYNTVTLSFIAFINPQRQTFYPLSGQISPPGLAVPNTPITLTFSSPSPRLSIYLPIHAHSPRLPTSPLFPLNEVAWHLLQKVPLLLSMQCQSWEEVSLDSASND